MVSNLERNSKKDMWKETTKFERNLKIFKDEFEDFLPSRILDFHVHVFSRDTVPPGCEKYLSSGGKVVQYTIEELKQDLAELYPGRDCYALCFGTPRRELNTYNNNEYVAKSCDHKHFFSLRLLRPEEDPKVVTEDIRKKRFLGFKPYLNYVDKEVEDVEINDMLPARIMEVADKFGLIVTLHIPRKARLADPLNQRQIVALAEHYPGAKIVLAHIGRAYFLKNIVGHLDKIRDFPNIYYDLAMLNNWEVLEYLFHNVEPYKILYGTDTPIALAPGKSVEINNQYAYITPGPWEAGTVIMDESKKLIYTSFVYEEIRAIKKAVGRLNLSGSFVEGLFYCNGMKLLERTGKNIYS